MAPNPTPTALTPLQDGEGTDLARMRSILIQLKNEPIKT